LNYSPTITRKWLFAKEKSTWRRENKARSLAAIATICSRDFAASYKTYQNLRAARKQQEQEMNHVPGPSNAASASAISLASSHNNVIHRGLWPMMIAAGVVTIDKDTGEKSPKYTGLHALRHFYASWLINRKKDGGLELPAKVVQYRMGHSSIEKPVLCSRTHSSGAAEVFTSSSTSRGHTRSTWI